jgi:MFS superfamily sulfate permease-like transporter
MQVKNIIPSHQDFLASIVVFLVALPLCMGIAIASGVPPVVGLITGMVGGLIVGVLSGSPLQVSGPAAGLAVLVWEEVQRYGVETLGVITTFCGIIQISAALFQLGQWFRAVSPAVIHGMLAGIGILICASQIHVLFDHPPKGSGIQNILSIPESVMTGISIGTLTVHSQAAWIGVLTISSLILWNKFRPKALKFMPGALMGVILGSLVANFFNLRIKYVEIPENVFNSIQWFTIGGFLNVWSFKILMTAATFALIASAETLLCATAVDQMSNRSKTKYNKELFAQGIGNFICGLMGALPMTGVIVRSSANVQAGAKTRASTILHGAWLLLLSEFFPSILRYIPISALAAVLVFTGYRLVDIAKIRKLNSYGRAEVGIYFATLITIVLTDLLTGVALGLVLSTLKILYVLTHLQIHLVQKVDQNHVRLDLKGTATFFHVPKLASILERLPQHSEVEINVNHLSYIDHACLELFADWEKSGGKILMSSSDLPKGAIPSDLKIQDHHLEKTA